MVPAVALIGFNRPEHTRRTLDAIRAARPAQLFLVADGPRAGHPEDAGTCAAVRAVMDSVDWPCEVHRRYSDANLGCEGNIETGLDWLFAQVGEAVIVEDDCVADPTFFDFAAELLERYRDDRRVWQIAGNGHGVPAARFGADSYRFAAWASVWGWATWADRWQWHRRHFPRTHQGAAGNAPVRATPVAIPPGQLVTRGGRAHFAEAASSTDVVRHGWDKHWWLTMLTEGALAATPAVNMVQNIGFGAGATHGVFERDTEPARAMPMPLRHPAQVALDCDVERELELLLSRLGGRAAQLARRYVTHPALRRVARSVLHSNTAAGVTRLASRMIDRRGGPRAR